MAKWINLKVKASKASDDRRIFRMYGKQEITYQQMKLRFMWNNEIDELSDEVFVNWMNGLGWHIRMPACSKTDYLYKDGSFEHMKYLQDDIGKL